VKRNIERFPEDFMFQLTKGELEILRSQFVILKKTDYLHTRLQLDALALHWLCSALPLATNGTQELQAGHRQQPQRKPIGFIQPNNDNDEEI